MQTLPQNWKLISLRDLCNLIQYGYNGAATKQKSGPKFLRITDIVKDNIDWAHVPYSKSKLKDNEKIKYKLETGDIVIARTGATVGYAKRIFNQPESIFASYLVRIRLKKSIDDRYIGFVIESDIYKKYIKMHQGGAAQPNANANILTSFPVPLPEDIKIQKKISLILSNYHDLIENNLKRIKILEDISESLYREWFVNFSFPGHKKTKMKKDGNKEIPHNWNKVKLKEICTLISRGSSLNYTEKSKTKVLNQKCLRHGEIFLKSIKYADELPITKQHLYLKKNDILINSMGVGTLGRVSRNVTIKDKMIIHNCIAVVRPNSEKLSSEYIYYHIKQYENYFINISKGTTGQTSLDINDIKNILILIPKDDIYNQYTKVITPIWSQIGILKNKSKILNKSINLLLPKLILGKIDVSKLDIKGSSNESV